MKTKFLNINYQSFNDVIKRLSASRPSGIIRLVDGNSQWSMVSSASGNGTRPFETGCVFQ